MAKSSNRNIDEDSQIDWSWLAVVLELILLGVNPTGLERARSQGHPPALLGEFAQLSFSVGDHLHRWRTRWGG